jgi:anti-anti-sigma factor
MTDRDRTASLAVQVVERVDGTLVVQLTGEIDISTAEILIDQFRVISAERIQNVILDATEVEFIDSAGLHALIEGKRMIREGGTNLVLVPSRQVRRVLELVFPEPLFAARVDSVEEAFAWLVSHPEGLNAASTARDGSSG